MHVLRSRNRPSLGYHKSGNGNRSNGNENTDRERDRNGRSPLPRRKSDVPGLTNVSPKPEPTGGRGPTLEVNLGRVSLPAKPEQPASVTTLPFKSDALNSRIAVPARAGPTISPFTGRIFGGGAGGGRAGMGVALRPRFGLPHSGAATASLGGAAGLAAGGILGPKFPFAQLMNLKLKGSRIRASQRSKNFIFINYILIGP